LLKVNPVLKRAGFFSYICFMEEQLVNFKTAKLAKKVNFDIDCRLCINKFEELEGAEDYTGDPYFSVSDIKNSEDNGFDMCLCPTQSTMQRWIRETREVHIMVNRNASGWFWEMMRADGGTDLGYSGYSGPNAGGVWDTYEEALENGLQVQLNKDLPRTTKWLKHWGNYAELAIKEFNLENK